MQILSCNLAPRSLLLVEVLRADFQRLQIVQRQNNWGGDSANFGHGPQWGGEPFAECALRRVFQWDAARPPNGRERDAHSAGPRLVSSPAIQWWAYYSLITSYLPTSQSSWRNWIKFSLSFLAFNNYFRRPPTPPVRPLITLILLSCAHLISLQIYHQLRPRLVFGHSELWSIGCPTTVGLAAEVLHYSCRSCPPPCWRPSSCCCRSAIFIGSDTSSYST